MRPAFVSLLMISAHVSVMVDCRPKLWHRDMMGNFNTRTPVDFSAEFKHFQSEQRTSWKKSMQRGLFVILPVGTSSNTLVSIFDLRSNRFLCLNIKGALYKSTQKDKVDCFYQRVWSDRANHHDVLHSISGHWLFRVGGKHLLKVPQKPSDVSSDLLKKLLQPIIKRRRRSDEVNPSDPLRSQSNPSRPAKDGGRGQIEQEQTGSVSKETITSVDDPLWVLRPNNHGSPVKTNIEDRAEHQ